MTAAQTENAHVEVVGVDACRKGWMAVRLVGGRFRDARFCEHLRDVAAGPDPAIVAVDIPLGLTERGWRECDQLVYGELGPLRNSVFRIPSRAVVETRDYKRANARCREVMEQGLSRQAHALFPKILEADQLRRRGVFHLHEVHPEMSFRTMAHAPLRWAKRTWNGQNQRRALLAEEGVERPDDLSAAGRVAVDDVIDAAAAAWSAHRIAVGRAESSPTPAQLDPSGLPIAIWY
jgi:predicted RNase H-like nuclease